MTVEAAKATLAREVKRAWPNVTKASELPYTEYWKMQTEWLMFYTPRLGDKLLERFVAGIIEIAKTAERDGLVPEPWTLPENARATRANATGREAKRTVEVKIHITAPKPASISQGSLGSW